MTRQFFTTCRGCGKQILMTLSTGTGRWVPCNPRIQRFTRSGGPATFVSEDGELCRGYRNDGGEWGYHRHTHRGTTGCR